MFLMCTDCSYHSRLEAFPIRQIVKERVRNVRQQSNNNKRVMIIRIVKLPCE